jgi:hypothetical protein
MDGPNSAIMTVINRNSDTAMNKIISTLFLIKLRFIIIYALYHNELDLRLKLMSHITWHGTYRTIASGYE